MRADERLHRRPGAFERWEILLAQRVHVDAVDALQMFGENLRHWKAEAAARRGGIVFRDLALAVQRSEEHTSELQSLMRISYAVFCLKKKKKPNREYNTNVPYKKHLHNNVKLL